MHNETLTRMTGSLLSRIAAPARFSLIASRSVFNDTVLSWLTNPDLHLPNSSIVGLCCSSLLGLQFQEETAGTDGLAADFRRFLLAASLAHGRWRGVESAQSRDLRAGGQASGCRLIKRLGRVLTPQFLARYDREFCQVLFLLVLGAALGIGNQDASTPVSHDDQARSPEEVLGPELRQSPTLWLALKEHLCQMLAHHLIFLGSMLGIRMDAGMERRIVNTAASEWNKAASSLWVDAVNSGRDSQPIAPGAAPASSQAAQGGKRDVMLVEGRSRPDTASQGPSPPVAIPFPDTAQPAEHQSSKFDGWSENPQSYLSMFEEPDSPASDVAGGSSPEKEVKECCDSTRRIRQEGKF